MGLIPIKTDLTLAAKDFEKKSNEALPVFGRIKKDSEELAIRVQKDAEQDLKEVQTMIRDTSVSNQAANVRGSQLLDDLDVSLAEQKRAKDMNPLFRKVRSFFGDDKADIKQINRDISFTQNRLTLFNQKEILRRGSLNDALRNFTRRNTAETNLFQTERAKLDAETQALAQSVGLMKTRFDVVASAARAESETLIRDDKKRKQFLSGLTIAQLQSRGQEAGRGAPTKQDGFTLTQGDFENELIKKQKERIALQTATVSLQKGRVDLANSQYEQVTGSMGTDELTNLAANGGVIPATEEGGDVHQIPMDIIKNALVSSIEDDNKLAELQVAQQVDLNEVIRNTQQTSDTVESVVRHLGSDSGFDRIDPQLRNNVSKSLVQLQGLLPRNPDGTIAVQDITGARASAINKKVDQINADLAIDVKRVSEIKFPKNPKAQVGYQAYLTGQDIDQGSASDILFNQLTGATPEGLANQPEYLASWTAMTNTAVALLSEALSDESPMIAGLSPRESREAMVTMMSQLSRKSGGKFEQDAKNQRIIQQVMEAGRVAYEGALHERFQVASTALAAQISYLPPGPATLGQLDNLGPRPHPFAQVPKQMMDGMLANAATEAAKLTKEKSASLSVDELRQFKGVAYNQAFMKQLQFFGAGTRFSLEFETAADAFIDLMSREDVRGMIQSQVSAGKDSAYASYLTANGALGADVMANWDFTVDLLRENNADVTGQLLKNTQEVLQNYSGNAQGRDLAILSGVGEITGMTEDQIGSLFTAVQQFVGEKVTPTGQQFGIASSQQQLDAFTSIILSGSFEDSTIEKLRKTAAKEWIVVARATDASMARLNRTK